MGHLRLRHRVRRVPAARRAPRRPVGAPADVHGGRDPVLLRLPHVRPLLVGGVPDRLPGPPGPGRGHPLPAALSILMTTFAEGRERNVALGVWGAVAGSGAAAGTLLGGVLTSGIGWEWIFFVNVPVGA